MKYGLDLVKNTSRSVLSAAREQVEREQAVMSADLDMLDLLADSLATEMAADMLARLAGTLSAEGARLRAWRRNRLSRAAEVRLIMLEQASLQTGE